jgi:hypothetical protein
MITSHRRRALPEIVAIAAGLVSAGVLLSARAGESADRKVQFDAAPPEFNQIAIGYLQSGLGEVTEVYSTASTSLHNWAELEPGRASSVGDSIKGDALVYAIFVHGKFQSTSPMGDSPAYDGGRLVIGGDGQVLSVWLWNDGDPPKDVPFDESYDA